MADALRRNMDYYLRSSCDRASSNASSQGEFVEIIRERKPREATTQRMLEMEKSDIQTMLDGQGHISRSSQ